MTVCIRLAGGALFDALLDADHDRQTGTAA